MARFCPRCGAPRAAPESPGYETPPQGGLLKDREDYGERRQLTVLFSDLVGFTALSEALDPEDLRSAVREFQHVCSGVVQELEGHVAQLLGDGILVYFGYPRAHEDDPVRAVNAALTVLQAVPDLNERLADSLPQLRDHPIHARIGVHTGRVVVGQMGTGQHSEQLALGSAANVAARLQQAAEPGTVVISDATRRLIGGHFALESEGHHELKGISEPVAVYRVLGIRDDGPDHGAGDPALGATQPIGREQETALLLERWDQAREGHGQVVLLRGEAGIGKSRLIHFLRNRVEGHPHSWLEMSCSPYAVNSSFRPVVDLLSQTLELRRDEDPSAQVARLEHALQGAGLVPEEVLPLVASLLSLPLQPPYTASQLAPDVRRKRLIEALHAWLLSLSDRQPIVLVVEDLHWGDPSTLELLGLFLDQVPTSPILLLLTARPEFESPWHERSDLEHLALHRLSRAQVTAMAEQITEGRDLPPEVLDQIVRKTDGVPLFVEELTKMVTESDLVRESGARYELAGRVLDLAIPSTLEDSLMARLDRLGRAKEVAQLAAVLGRSFSAELLEAVHAGDGELVRRSLAELLDAELLYRRGLGPGTEYTFKHALIQELAYQSLLKPRRQGYHRRVAHVLEERFLESGDAEPESLARHFEGAGDPERAVFYLQQAGDRAIDRSAHAEAIAHLRKGIELLDALPEGPERSRQELMLQVSLGSPLMASQGYSSPEVEEAYRRARTLSQEVADAPQLFRALWGLAAYYQASANLEAAREIAAQLLELAERSGERELLLLANVTTGNNAYYAGAWADALPYLEEAMRLYDPVEDAGLAYVYGQDPGMIAAAFAAICHWHLGRPDHGLRQAEAALEQGRRAKVHPLGLAFSLCFVGMLYFLRRDREGARACAEEAMGIAEEHGFALELGLAHLLYGWCLVDEGKAEGIETMQQGFDELSATGATVGGAAILTVLAVGNAHAGRSEAALGCVKLGLGLSRQQQNPCWDPELLRLKGDLLAADSASEAEAEKLLRQASQLAREQGSRSLEIRAAISLARLLRRRGRAQEVRELLGPLAAAFSEGFETQDLRDARELLEAS
jgi:class 3 adenylate cyclase/tetratricopeptide (TPR) repeat protein